MLRRAFTFKEFIQRNNPGNFNLLYQIAGKSSKTL
jgi:hypothetical protein